MELYTVFKFLSEAEKLSVEYEDDKGATLPLKPASVKINAETGHVTVTMKYDAEADEL